MTALSEYQMLECPGLWREGPGAQKREVIVAFGDATLVIADTRSATPLSHWSLPAVHRTNPGATPAVFAPDGGGGEELELDDAAMIAAIGKVNAIIEARRPHPGRLRQGILLATLAAIAAAGSLWLPGAIIAHTATVVPNAERNAIGAALLTDIRRLSGAPCDTPEGAAALDRLAGRVLAGGQAVVVPEGVSGVIALPGDIFVIGGKLVAAAGSPEALAGYLLAAHLRAEERDPLPAFLVWAGARTSFRLLTSGGLPAGAAQGYAETLLTTPPAPVAAEPLLQRFIEAGVPASPYAYAVDPSGESTLALIEADPFRATPPPAPILADTDWVALQGICDG